VILLYPQKPSTSTSIGVLDESRLGSKSRNCPWLGRSLDAGVAGTMAGGVWAYRGKRLSPAAAR
ncbi:MAG: hypothetical protein J0L61_11805, partial [Planctomycetes bacterium]|nr:hypothetical protein [Planctomycetota bacterium]